MKFDGLLAGIVSGAFALFSADLTGHVAVPVSYRVSRGDAAVDDAGSSHTRIYECSHDSPLLRRCGMDRWTHRETLRRVHRARAEVTDELVWPKSHVSRSYVLTDDAVNGIVRTNGGWTMTAKPAGPLASAVRRGVMATLRASDEKLFRAFIAKIDDDESDDDGDDGGPSPDDSGSGSGSDVACSDSGSDGPDVLGVALMTAFE